MQNAEISGYVYNGHELNCAHAYLLPAVEKILGSLTMRGDNKRIFELGCGNGSVANELSQKGFEIIGVDPSEMGIDFAQRHYPNLKIYKGSAYDDLAATYGKFPVVISLEVVEHVYFPRKFAETLFNIVEPDGIAIVSTPYHGYWKNLTLALSGKMDSHFTALWDYGHIKFWSMKTLDILLQEAGFKEISFLRVGRISPLAKSMIAIAQKS